MLLVGAPSQAIGKATATPEATPIPEDLDAEEALDAVLKHIERRENDAAIALGDAHPRRRCRKLGCAITTAPSPTSGKTIWTPPSPTMTAALTLRPGYAATWRLRGDTHLRDQNPRAALSDYRQSLFVNPRSLQTYHSLVGLHDRDVDKTVHYLYQTIVDALRASARGSANRAIDTLSDLIDSFDRRNRPPELAYAFYLRGNIWTGEEDWASALADFNAGDRAAAGYAGFLYGARLRLCRDGRGRAGWLPTFIQRMILLERENFDATLAPGETVAVEHGLRPGRALDL